MDEVKEEMLHIGPGPKLQPGEIGLWDVNPRHPDGEIKVAENLPPVDAAPTQRVLDGLGSERLVRVAKAAGKPAASTSSPSSAAAAAENDTSVPPGITMAQRNALIAAGFVTVEDIRNATDAQLDAVEGIGPQTIVALRAATRDGV